MKKEKGKYEAKPARRWGMWLGSLVLAVMTAAAVWLPVLRLVGNSMEPTLFQGDILLFWKTADPVPGELVSFSVGSKLLIKRCIAGPGQRLESSTEGWLLIDGQPQDIPAEGWETELPCTVPEDHYFCVGDKWEGSVDSRHKVVGFVARGQILGKPILRLWPWNRLGIVT